MKRIVKRYIIYTLSCPKTNVVKYIGQTYYIKDRFRQHIAESRRTEHYKSYWIRSLMNEGLKPIIEVLDVVEESDANFWEKYWIEQFKSWNFSLVNSIHNNGYKETDDYKLLKKNNPFTPIAVKRDSYFKYKESVFELLEDGLFMPPEIRFMKYKASGRILLTVMCQFHVEEINGCPFTNREYAEFLNLSEAGLVLWIAKLKRDNLIKGTIHNGRRILKPTFEVSKYINK